MDIIKNAAQHLSRTAVSAGGRQYTYHNLLESSDRVSKAIHQVVSKAPGLSTAPPRIGLYAAPGPEYLAGTLAIWQAGGIVVPLATSHPQRELAYVLQDAGISAVLTAEAHASKLADVCSEHKAALQVLDPVTSSGAGLPSSLSGVPGLSLPRSAASSPSAQDQGALIIYTSGTTGKPKGVLHTHRGLHAQVRGLVAAWQWQASDTIVHPLPLHHIHGIVNALYCPAYVGAHVRVMPKFSAAQLWQEMMDGKLSVFMGVPTMYSYLLGHYDTMSPALQEQARAAAAALRLTVSGSSACPTPIMERWKELTGSYLLERYGMTEIGMALSNPLQGTRLPGAVGTPLPGVSAEIAADGELLIKGSTLFQEYWGRPEATREAFTSDGWFKTGDSADKVTLKDPADPGAREEYFRILGRSSVDIIKSAGYKLSALMIESAILEHPGVEEVAVLGVPDEVYGEVVTALVARKASHAALGQRELTGFCRERLAAYQTPKRWRFVDKLARNAMGKLNKKEMIKELLAAEAGEGAAAAAAAAPAS